MKHLLGCSDYLADAAVRGMMGHVVLAGVTLTHSLSLHIY